MKTKFLLILTFIFSTFAYSQEVLSPNDEDNYNGVPTEEMRMFIKRINIKQKRFRNILILYAS